MDARCKDWVLTTDRTQHLKQNRLWIHEGKKKRAHIYVCMYLANLLDLLGAVVHRLVQPGQVEEAHPDHVRHAWFGVVCCCVRVIEKGERWRSDCVLCGVIKKVEGGWWVTDSGRVECCVWKMGEREGADV